MAAGRQCAAPKLIGQRARIFTNVSAGNKAVAMCGGKIGGRGVSRALGGVLRRRPRAAKCRAHRPGNGGGDVIAHQSTLLRGMWSMAQSVYDIHGHLA